VTAGITTNGVEKLSFIGNIIWLVLGGILGAVAWFIAGLLLCVTIIGLPFGIQCFKIAGFVLWPFGREVDIGNFGACGFILNILWILLLGWELAAYHLAIGLILCITVVGIPFGLQHFKLSMLGLVPFGARIRLARIF
jgi:Predicted membrane protein